MTVTKRKSMKIKLFILLNLFFVVLGYSQGTSKNELNKKSIDTIRINKTVTVYDTIINKETTVVSFDTLNQSIIHSEYNRLYEQLLDQKQKHYDSSLSALQWISGILAAIITIGAIIFGFFGYNSIEKIRNRLREDFDSEKIEIEKKIKSEASKIVSHRYEKEINELKEKVLNFERFAEDASSSFSVKRGKEKPELKQEIKTPSRTSNPFDKDIV